MQTRPQAMQTRPLGDCSISVRGDKQSYLYTRTATYTDTFTDTYTVTFTDTYTVTYTDTFTDTYVLV